MNRLYLIIFCFFFSIIFQLKYEELKQIEKLVHNWISDKYCTEFETCFMAVIISIFNNNNWIFDFKISEWMIELLIPNPQKYQYACRAVIWSKFFFS